MTPELSAHVQLCLVDVFTGSKARGNRHTLVYGECWQWVEPFMACTTPNLVLLSGSPADLYAQFRHAGQRVRRCGSGNLAIAAFVRDQLAPFDESPQWRLTTPEADIVLGYDAHGPFYRDTPLFQTPLQHPRFWRYLLGATWLGGRYVGAEEDYALLEVSGPPALYKPRLSFLCTYSRRALILVSRARANGAELRYFAPQYAAKEDSATGSACVQAASYLSRRYSRSSWLFKQSSPAGGLIRARVGLSGVFIGGRAKVRALSYRHFADRLGLAPAAH